MPEVPSELEEEEGFEFEDEDIPKSKGKKEPIVPPSCVMPKNALTGTVLLLDIYSFAENYAMLEYSNFLSTSTSIALPLEAVSIGLDAYSLFILNTGKDGSFTTFRNVLKIATVALSSSNDYN